MTVQFLGQIALPAETTWYNFLGTRIMQASADLGALPKKRQLLRSHICQ
jgi:hypothetical protein